MTSPNLSFSLRTIRIIRTDRPTINDVSLIACEKKRITKTLQKQSLNYCIDADSEPLGYVLCFHHD